MSLRRQRFSSREIILIDNASSDGSVDRITAEFPEVRVIASPVNLGVAAGRNLGAERAAGEIVFFLDNDALIDETVLEKIVAAFSNRPRLGIISLHIKDHLNGGLDPECWIFPRTITARAGEIFPAYSFCGCGFAVRHRLFYELGGLRDAFFFCGEEDEFAIRALNKGFGIEYRGDIVVWHRHSPKERFQGSRRLSFCLRNRLLTIWMHYPFRQAVRMTMIRCASYAIKGGRAGSYSLVPMACFSAALLWRRAGLRRFPMEAAVWSRYCKLNNNLSIRWLCWRRIRLKMQEPRFSGIQPLKKNRP